MCYIFGRPKWVLTRKLGYWCGRGYDFGWTRHCGGHNDDDDDEGVRHINVCESCDENIMMGTWKKGYCKWVSQYDEVVLCCQVRDDGQLSNRELGFERRGRWQWKMNNSDDETRHNN